MIVGPSSRPGQGHRYGSKDSGGERGFRKAQLCSKLVYPAIVRSRAQLLCSNPDAVEKTVSTYPFDMAFSGQLKGIFGGGPQPVAPPRVSTDEVLPVHFFDDSATNRTLIISWTLRFNEVLDADKLNNSLQKLLSIGGWRRLGGRLRETVWFTAGIRGAFQLTGIPNRKMASSRSISPRSSPRNALR